MEVIIRQLKDLQTRLNKALAVLNLAEKEAEIKKLEDELAQPNVWDNPNEAGAKAKLIEELKNEIKLWQSFENDLNNALEMANEANAGEAEEFIPELEKQANLLEAKYNKIEFALLFSGEYDSANAFISIHAGTGGTEAQDWAEMLERMYLRYGEKKGWSCEVLERTMGNEAGIKSCMLKISGRFAYGHLRSEAGVHRLVRISPFDAESLRQTSFALVEVLPELPASADVDIKPEEIEIEFHRSSGPGGQNVNKVSSAVRLKHLPTGIVIVCQTERNQAQNREQAMAILKAKLKTLASEARADKNSEIKGAVQKAEWGRQIRSYVLQPYQMVKDHRTNYETSATANVLDGELDQFVEAYLRLGVADNSSKD